MQEPPARHQPILLTAVALTAVCAVLVPLGVAIKVLPPGILAFTLLLGCAMVWVVYLIERHEDRVVRRVDEVRATVTYQQRPRVMRDGQR